MSKIIKWLLPGVLVFSLFSSSAIGSYRALELNGSGYCSISDASAVGLDMGLSDFMIEGYIKTTTKNFTIVSKSTPTGYSFYLTTADGKLEFYINNGTAVSTTANTVVTDGRWHHVAVVFDRSGSAYFFLDGAADGSGVISGSAGSLDNTDPFYVGYDRYGGEEAGTYDELRIWNFGVDGLPVDYATYIAWRALKQNAFKATSEYDSDSWASYITNNLSAYYKLNGDYTDDSNSNDLTAGGSGNTFPGYSLVHPAKRLLGIQ